MKKPSIGYRRGVVRGLNLSLKAIEETQIISPVLADAKDRIERKLRSFKAAHANHKR